MDWLLFGICLGLLLVDLQALRKAAQWRRQAGVFLDEAIRHHQQVTTQLDQFAHQWSLTTTCGNDKCPECAAEGPQQLE